MTQNVENQNQFEKLINSEEPVVIKFVADWCPDCKRMDFFIGSVLEQFDEFPFYEMDRDQFPEIAETYQVMGIPSLLVFKDGEKIGHLHSANAKTPDEVTNFLNDYFQKVTN
ncbi:thioredoxin family protein [Piscibacillus halophilus]|uniref:Thioredoxin n=1 Tax=Piscibacillus halophilus TaxID=571933 RepID=A0A1H9IL25_9BACI|nr:thioredoxin family protein [Piscibacillus halophilus]SEQ75085.1 Thioredoxin [Piscibacillus halophilus]